MVVVGTGPRLLNHVFTLDPTIDVRSPFTPALGLKIAPNALLTSKVPVVSTSAKAANAIGSSSCLYLIVTQVVTSISIHDDSFRVDLPCRFISFLSFLPCATNGLDVQVLVSVLLVTVWNYSHNY